MYKANAPTFQFINIHKTQSVKTQQIDKKTNTFEAALSPVNK